MNIIRTTITLLVGVLLGFGAFWYVYSRPQESASLHLSRMSSGQTPFQGYDSRVFPFVESEVVTRLEERIGYKEAHRYLIMPTPTFSGFDLLVCAPTGMPELADPLMDELFQLTCERVEFYSAKFRRTWHTPGLE
jgi:hypothetical protein